MKNPQTRVCAHNDAAQRWPGLLFALTVILSVLVTYRVTGTIIDSDASSELVLAQHWIDTGGILSQDWIYGSEIRLLHIQLVYVPLLLIFDSWQTVRFLGALILQAIYLVSFAFLAKQAGLSRRVFYIGGSMLLLPVSVTYGRIVLYHNHYIPNIALSFFLLGLVLHFEGEEKKRKHWLCLGVLTVLSVLGGVNSVRQLMITHAPMLAGLVLICLAEDLRGAENAAPALLSRRNLRLLLAALWAAGCSFVGMKLNTAVLSPYYTSSRTPTNHSMGFLDPDYLNDMLYGLFHQFGFRSRSGMLSLEGLLSLASLVVCGFCLCVSFRILQKHRREDGLGKAVVQNFFFLHLLVMGMVFLVTEDVYYYPLYLSLCYPWAVIALVIHWTQIPKAIAPFHARKLLAWGCVAVLMVNGLVNMTWFCGGQLVHQPYEGLLFQDQNKKANLEGAVAFLTENGYELGYATYWEANIVTEITDGDIRLVNLQMEKDQDEIPTGNLSYYDCLTSLYLREAEAPRRCLLLSRESQESFETAGDFQFCTLVYQDDYHCVYDITDQERFVTLLYT